MARLKYFANNYIMVTKDGPVVLAATVRLQTAECFFAQLMLYNMLNKIVFPLSEEINDHPYREHKHGN